MVTNERAGVNASDREIVTKRTFDAPRELVFKMWTDPQHVGRWWGPNGFTTTTLEIDVRPGGAWRFIMHGPDGIDYPNRIAYEEIVEPERLVYTHGDDSEGKGGEFHTTVTFEDRDGKTVLTMRALFATAAQRDTVVEEFGAIEGAMQTLNRLAEYLESQK
jgi:uncharacterized protein YndB with AHSA1/START domain